MYAVFVGFVGQTRSDLLLTSEQMKVKLATEMR